MRKFVPIICLIYSLFCYPGQYGNIVFSELMIDPEPAVGLPEIEYIELYNRSEQSLSLKGWTFVYGEKTYAFPVCRIDSAGYIILCSKSAEKKFISGSPLAVFASFPALTNNGKAMALLNNKNETVTYLEYGSDWYRDGFKSQGGWSLECIDVNNFSGQASNWTSSTDIKGGTPGAVNSVLAINPDKSVPFCNGIFVPSSKQLELTFSKSMKPDELTHLLNYEISPKTTVVSSALPDNPACRSVILNLSDSLISGDIYSLKLTNLMDVSSLPLKEIDVLFGLPETPGVSDLSLNEVLFNPVSNGCDYIEFVNVSRKCLDLSQVWLSNKTTSGLLNAGIRLSVKPKPCNPGSYWLLSLSADTVQSVNNFPAIPNFIDLTSFPSMPDASGNIVLSTTSAQIIDEMNYKESMHFPLMSNCEGVSLEKLNPELSSLNTENWVSASSTSGYGTPGFPNSQYRALNEIMEEGFTVEKKWLSPNGDGLDDLISISYRMEKSSMANLTVYDLNGREVRHLLNNELLSAAGTIFWDGTTDDGRLVTAGRYILQVDYFKPEGQRNKKRFVLTVLF